MSNGTIGVICGSGTGRTAMAFGKAINALVEGKHVIVIQFLKASQDDEDWSMLKRLEPELKIFRFERAVGVTEEAHLSTLNGLNFAKKVMATGECELLVLDGILNLLEHRIVSVEEFKQVLTCREDARIILTGDAVPAGLEDYANSIERIEQVDIDKAVQ